MEELWKKAVLVFLSGLFFLLQGQAAQAYSYGPACQWIRLVGSLEIPEELEEPWPLYLTVQYRLLGESNINALLTNYPLRKEDFIFVLAGFAEEINEVVFLPIRLPFSETIEFIYWVRSGDQTWRSETKSSFYRPQKIENGEESLCQTRIEMESLLLKRVDEMQSP